MTQVHDLKKQFENLEQFLGSIEQDDALLQTTQILQDDEDEHLSQKQLEALKEWGFFNYFIPASLGGQFHNLQDIYWRIRAVSRRDLTLAIALGVNFLASMPVWLSKNEKLKKTHANHVRQGKISALALTEKAHGSDLVSSEVTACFDEQSWCLNGEKWCVNYATLGDILIILCRSHEQKGPLSCSLFYIDKSQIKKEIQASSKLLTHGVRGLDISGFQLNNLKLSPEQLIGSRGEGLSLIFKALQASRVLCSGLALGGAEQAIRMTIEFSQARILYDKPVFELPVTKQRLVECFCLQLIQDCLTQSVIRGASLVPQQLSMWSAVVKFITPLITKLIIEHCEIVLGARGYLREGPYALFQKIKRDAGIIGLFDGSSEVNLYLISSNMVHQAKRRQEPNEIPPHVNQIFDLTESIKDFNGDLIELSAKQSDCIFDNLNHITSEELEDCFHILKQKLSQLDEKVLSLHKKEAFIANNLLAFRFAESYGWLLAASCVLQIWHYNRNQLPKPLNNPSWVKLSIDIILNQLESQTSHFDEQLQNDVSEDMIWFIKQNQLISTRKLTIANQDHEH